MPASLCKAVVDKLAMRPVRSMHLFRWLAAVEWCLAYAYPLQYYLISRIEH